MQLIKGQKVKLDESIQNQEIKVNFKYDAPFDINVGCFGMDEDGHMHNPKYQIFYNQKVSLNNEIKLDVSNTESNFLIKLSQLPPDINKLVFTASVDKSTSQAMSALRSLEFSMNEMSFSVTGTDFSQEKAVIIAEIYKKFGIWRLGISGQGFNGGIEALVANFGGQPLNLEKVTQSTAPAPVEVKKISLEKRFEEKAPELISLAKLATISLEKNGLTAIKAKAAFVIDASGSMTTQYNQGQVQETLNRVFPLGVHFDDNNELETWAFAKLSKKLSNVTFANYKSYVNQEDGGWKKWMSQLNSGYNNEPAVIKDVIQHFAGLTPPEPKFQNGGFLGFGKKLEAVNEYAPAITSKTPVFVLFISDGGVDKNDEIEHLIKWSSSLPIFWQFIGIGGYSYGALEKLDDLQGRYLDNADFFSIDDLNEISESELYDRMMAEFPKWLEMAKAKGIIDN
jgi:stress response protein SCP2